MPANGVYFIFEVGESAHGGDRIVRVGSHRGEGNLRNRLIEHTTLNKDRSIFRKNLGRSLLKRGGDPFANLWEIDLTKRIARDQYGPLIDTNKQRETEEAVSKHIIENLTCSVIGAAAGALELEQRCIGTISRCAVCAPSSNWLGLHSPKEQIRESGMWQVQHLYCEALSEDRLKLLEGETIFDADLDPPSSSVRRADHASEQATISKVPTKSVGDALHPNALQTGALLNNYTVERVLGVGGFGITYEAREHITDRKVAIKEYLPSNISRRGRDGRSAQPNSPKAGEDFNWGLARFRQEAKLLIRLKHPNIVSVLS